MSSCCLQMASLRTLMEPLYLLSPLGFAYKTSGDIITNNSNNINNNKSMCVLLYCVSQNIILAPPPCSPLLHSWCNKQIRTSEIKTLHEDLENLGCSMTLCNLPLGTCFIMCKKRQHQHCSTHRVVIKFPRKKNACERSWARALLFHVICGPVVLASPMSWREKLNPKPQSRNPESESATELGGPPGNSHPRSHTHFEKDWVGALFLRAGMRGKGAGGEEEHEVLFYQFGFFLMLWVLCVLATLRTLCVRKHTVQLYFSNFISRGQRFCLHANPQAMYRLGFHGHACLYYVPFQLNIPYRKVQDVSFRVVEGFIVFISEKNHSEIPLP